MEANNLVPFLKGSSLCKAPVGFHVGLVLGRVDEISVGCGVCAQG